jgi:phosphoribosylamine--glycine ligase
MEVAQDHKRAFDGDKGPNTGGMGAYSPIPFITKEDIDWAYDYIMCATANALIAEGCAFRGVLYGGLMKTPNGIKVIEFNARFGDPETEVVLPLIDSDIANVFESVAKGIEPAPIVWSKDVTLGIVLASKGYPGDYAKGFVIRGTEKVDGTVFHMGTAVKDGELVTAGGRVLFVVAKGATLADAHKKANEEVSKIECENLFHRTDIGHKAFK